MKTSSSSSHHFGSVVLTLCYYFNYIYLCILYLFKEHSLSFDKQMALVMFPHFPCTMENIPLKFLLNMKQKKTAKGNSLNFLIHQHQEPRQHISRN